MNKEDFVNSFGGVFEHSPWVAENAYSLLEEIGAAPRSSSSVHDIHVAMVSAFRRADLAARKQVLLAHPDLAGKLAQAKKLTEASTQEQASAGLDALTDDEREVFTQSNAAYVKKFGFPFIIAVRDNTKKSILLAFETRLQNSAEQEFEEACKQVERIAYHRLADMLE